MKILFKTNKLALIPNIEGRLKDHKENIPVRPIVLKCPCTTFCIEKAFVILLKNILSTSDHVISFTNEFTQVLNNN